MRVTSNSFPNALQYQLESLATKQARLQSQAATGQRFRTPSEDPRATRKVLELQQETRRLNQYNENIDLSSEKLNSVYGAIQALKKVSDRAGELAAMVDDMKSKDQLAAYRQEVNQLIEQSVQIGNTNNQFGLQDGDTSHPSLTCLGACYGYQKRKLFLRIFHQGPISPLFLYHNQC